MCDVYYSIKSVICLSINDNTCISIKCSRLFEKALVYLHFPLFVVRFVNQRQRWKLEPWKWWIFLENLKSIFLKRTYIRHLFLDESTFN